MKVEPMAHTTTATTTYSLLKYSRSYPTGSVNDANWQHFINPVLRLVLDVTKTENLELQSVRLKVSWTIQNGGIITVNDNSEIILASLGCKILLYFRLLNWDSGNRKISTS